MEVTECVACQRCPAACPAIEPQACRLGLAYHTYASVQHAANCSVCLHALHLLQVTSKQRQREAAAAAAAEGLEEGDDEEPIDLDDDIMGEGFSSFLARDEDSEAGMLVYEDDGDLS